MKREPFVFKGAALTAAAGPISAWRLAVAFCNEKHNPGRSRCEERAQLGNYCVPLLPAPGELARSAAVSAISLGAY
jgi:hypothetical protein